MLERERDERDRAPGRQISRGDERRAVECFARNRRKACGVHARSVPPEPPRRNPKRPDAV